MLQGENMHVTDYCKETVVWELCWQQFSQIHCSCCRNYISLFWDKFLLRFERVTSHSLSFDCYKCGSPDPQVVSGRLVSGSLHCICRGGCKWFGIALGSATPGGIIFFPQPCCCWCCCCCCCLTGPGQVLVTLFSWSTQERRAFYKSWYFQAFTHTNASLIKQNHVSQFAGVVFKTKTSALSDTTVGKEFCLYPWQAPVELLCDCKFAFILLRVVDTYQ